MALRIWFGRLILACGGLALIASMTHASDADYRAAIEKWRQEREARLTADDGWLTVAGLFWLQDGENRFGTDPLNDIVLPEGSGPAEIGVFEYRHGKTSVRIKDGVRVTMNGKPVRTAELRPSVPGPPDTLAIGDVTFFVHVSGERYAVRVKDKNSRLLREFKGLRWFPVNEAYRVTARFVAYEAPRTVQVPNILGDLETYTSPGTVAFTLNGQDLRMQALSASQDRVWFIFRDLTSGRETYHAARFLYADGPKDGKVVLDFNQAYNPPCAFNPFTTCPLPPPENRLRIRVEAGELDYGHGKTTESAGRP